MTDRDAFIAFNLVSGMGYARVMRLAQAHGGSVAAAYAAYPHKTDALGAAIDVAKVCDEARRRSVTLLTPCDADYPRRLRDLDSPPLALYVVGNAAALSRRGVAIVGSRRATAYGLSVAQTLARGLAERGWCVFSGLAQGIDAAAHGGSLLGKGCTVGVLGGGLDRFFPEENRDLARRMVDAGGAVVSEFPFGRPPDRQTFPQRNRIVAALSEGVVAVEAPLKSGTLITCSQALDLGRPVMAVPGRIDVAASAGCHQLLRAGARLVTSADEIAREILPLHAVSSRVPPSVPPAAPPCGKTRAAKPPTRPEETVSLEEAAVLKCVTEEGVSIDGIVVKSALAAAKVSSLLAGLRLKGRICFMPGNRVRLAQLTDRAQI